MEFEELKNRALKIRAKYAELEKKKYGREWTREEVFQGLVGDVGGLSKQVMVESDIRTSKDDHGIDHHLADCLWSLIVLAEKYNIDLEKSFVKTMNELEKKIASE